MKVNNQICLTNFPIKTIISFYYLNSSVDWPYNLSDFAQWWGQLKIYGLFFIYFSFLATVLQMKSWWLRWDSKSGPVE